jgi:NADH dehydrogenase (ubiquinone) Fe-S protein 4
MAIDLENVKKTVEERKKSVTPPHVAVVPDALSPALPESPNDTIALALQPELHRGRTVVISQKAQNAMTSASHASKSWRLSWKTEERWSNPLMGWTSTADPLSNAELKFETAEQAERFAAKHGWTCETEKPIVRDKRYGTNTYSHNFLFKHVEADIKANGMDCEHFVKAKPHKSHYFRPLKFHGDGECVQHGHDGLKPWKYEGSPETPWTKSKTTNPSAKWEPFAEAK